MAPYIVKLVDGPLQGTLHELDPTGTMEMCPGRLSSIFFAEDPERAGTLHGYALQPDGSGRYWRSVVADEARSRELEAERERCWAADELIDPTPEELERLADVCDELAAAMAESVGLDPNDPDPLIEEAERRFGEDDEDGDSGGARPAT